MRVSLLSLAVMSGLLASPVVAAPGDRCAALHPATTAAQSRADAALVTRVGKQKVAAAQVSHVLAEGDWRLVWATPADAERGVFFFHRAGRQGYRLVDTWGGVIAPDDRSGSIAWAQARAGHPSRRLATCFVDAVMARK
ncbi:hypothetical protein BH10PSE14_BH10PSE14_24760 [soil metagenome]